jgi:hypothetical protein
VKFIRILFLCAGLAAPAAVYADPIIGCVMFGSQTPRSASIQELFVSSIAEFSTAFHFGDPVNSALLSDQLGKFGCTDDRCLVAFSRDAKIDILVTGNIVDRGDFLEFDIMARSYRYPYNGKTIIRYHTKIPVSGKFSLREYGYIAQEQSARFLAELFARYRYPLPLQKSPDGVRVERPVSGRYPVYRKIHDAEFGFYAQQAGEVRFEKGVMLPDSGVAADDGFILSEYSGESRSISEYIDGRKREIVFARGSYEEPFFAPLLIPILSLSAPVSLPIGYYQHSDYWGMTLWVLNASPWWYLSWKGIDGHPLRLWDAVDKPSRQSSRDARFALYTAVLGNGALVIDMFAHDMLGGAARYESQAHYAGNDTTAAILALLTPGGGQFYRGNRLLGYGYYQLDNTLTYMMLTDLAEGKKSSAQRYAMALAVVKGIEIIHAYFSSDAIEPQDYTSAFEVMPLLEYQKDEMKIGVLIGSRW